MSVSRGLPRQKAFNKRDVESRYARVVLQGTARSL